MKINKKTLKKELNFKEKGHPALQLLAHIISSKDHSIEINKKLPV